MGGHKGAMDFQSGVLFPGSRPEDWARDPVATFDAWIAEQSVEPARQYRESARKAYRGFFQAWLAWLARSECSVLEARPADADAYFAQAALQPISRLRYLTLLHRVYKHLKSQEWSGVNPVAHLVHQERTPDADAPCALTEDDLETVRLTVDHLPGWKGQRDRALLAVLAGAGLRANEVVALTWADVRPDFSIQVKPEGVHLEHVTTILPGPWRETWQQWEVQHTQFGVTGPLAFPSSRAGRALTPAGLYRRVDGWLTAAGVKADEQGPGVLRNTFARMALRRYDPEEVQEFMGHAELRATLRHQDGLD